jgi:hypothetical protein
MTPNNPPDFDSAPARAGGDHAQVVSEHAIHRDGIISRYQMPIMFFVILLILGTVFIILGMTRAELYLSLIGGVVVVGGVACLGYVLKNMYRGVRRVILTESGIRWEDDQALHEKPWEDVREVYTKDVITRADRDTNLRVVFGDGTAMMMDNRLRKYQSLTKSLLSLSSRVLLEKKRRDLAADRAEFGPVVLYRDGVQVNEQKKSWEELEQWTVNNGCLYIISTNPKNRYGWEVSLFDVPNYPVLFQLLQEAWQCPTPAATSIPFGGGRRNSG